MTNFGTSPSLTKSRRTAFRPWVSAARLGLWNEARLALLASARVQPRQLRPWVRLAVACLPPLGRRVWRLQS